MAFDPLGQEAVHLEVREQERGYLSDCETKWINCLFCGQVREAKLPTCIVVDAIC